MCVEESYTNCLYIQLNYLTFRSSQACHLTEDNEVLGVRAPSCLHGVTLYLKESRLHETLQCISCVGHKLNLLSYINKKKIGYSIMLFFRWYDVYITMCTHCNNHSSRQTVCITTNLPAIVCTDFSSIMIMPRCACAEGIR